MISTSQKLFLVLYSSDPSRRPWLSYQHLRLLTPSLSYDGARSLVHFYKLKGLIRTEKVKYQARFTLTVQGGRHLERLLPVFSPRWRKWQGQVSMLVFLDAPGRDPGFRYLAGLLNQAGSIRLARGVYLYPGSFPDTIVNECQTSYLLSVVVFQIKEFLVGEIRNKIVSDSQAREIIKGYQEISNKLDQLLESKLSFGQRSDQTKQTICSLFDRFSSLVKTDIGACRHYFPQVVSPDQLLEKLQRLIGNLQAIG